jgi:hypothetical protein
MDATRRLKAELWRRFGAEGHPAEWDGRVYGGGKLSQRYWEYFRAVELLDLDDTSVVLDIGGGSPITGMGFFASLLSTVARKVVVLDPNVGDTSTAPENAEFVRSNGSYDVLKSLLSSRSDITHVASVSVFEHVEPAVREGMVRAIDECFRGTSFVATIEFHARSTFFEHQLTAKTMSDLFAPLTRFYPDEFSASPVWSENAFDTRRLVAVSPKSKRIVATGPIPRWYPVAVRFVPMPA